MFTKQTSQLNQALTLTFTLLLLILWFWLYWPVFNYLNLIFSQEDFRTNQLLLIGVGGLLVWQIQQGYFRWLGDIRPQWYPVALSMALGGSVLYLIVERYLAINTLSASLFALASYGLLGLWMQPQAWRQGLPAALLLVGTLPFGDHMQTFIGYPLRIFTATLIRDGLEAAGVAALGVDTILIFENGVSQVDMPCSGVKSLWTGMLFLLAATWLERRPINLTWGGIAILFAGLLFLVNIMRVGLLIILGPVAGWPVLSEMMHVPLGVLGFGGACAGALGLLRWRRSGDEGELIQKSTHPAWLAPILALIIFTFALIYTPRPHPGLTQAPPIWHFPPRLTINPMPLKPDERAWLTRDGAESATRFRFAWRDLTGSLILIISNTWRGHHRPERCFEVYGLNLNDSRAYLVRPDFPLRFVSLAGQDGPTLSASYWFQSATQTTDDYATRIWADLPPHRQRWILVSILFDDAYAPQADNVQAFYEMLHEVVQQMVARGT